MHWILKSRRVGSLIWRRGFTLRWTGTLHDNGWKCLSTRPYLVTTPIFYVNSSPHIGHLYTALIADAASRWQQLLGRDVLFSTGTDEHGLKIQQAAASQGLAPNSLCDTISQRFRRLFDEADIQYADFIRTTETRHQLAVNTLWDTINSNGFIYTGTYEGWYSPQDEAFLTEDQITEAKDRDGTSIKVSTESGHRVEWMKEDNYMFKLSCFGDRLRAWLDKDVVRPENYRPLVYRWIEDGLPDLSVSRSTSRLQWGIKVPCSNDQTIYVWLDALTNYLTVGGYPGPGHIWPADCHIVGKDILKFHAIYWPAFLMAAGLEPPKLIHCHGHWLINEEKMSKSKGNVVDPFAKMEQFTVDGLRYFLLREGVPHSDSQYYDQKVTECLNSELGNTVGNLLSRCTGNAVNPSQEFPSLCEEALRAVVAEESDDAQVLDNLAALPANVKTHYDDMNYYKAIDAIMQQLRDTNGFVQRRRPWVLRKEPGKQAELDAVIHVALESLRVAGILLQPVVPGIADTLLTRLNIARTKRTYEDTAMRNCAKHGLGENPGVLFKRIT